MENDNMTLWSAEEDKHFTFQVVAVPQETIVIDDIHSPTKKFNKKFSDGKNPKSKLHTHLYDPDKHCGVVDSTGNPCTNCITCRAHKFFEKWKVSGCSKKLNTLIKEHKSAMASASVKPYRDKHDADLICRVRDLKGYPCMRKITCNIHTIAEKHRVNERSETIEKLIKKHKMTRR